MTATTQVMDAPQTSCVSGDIQVSQEPLFSTSCDSNLIFSSGLAPVALFPMETNPEDANLSISEITTPNLSWNGMRHISSIGSISRPQFRSEDDYEVLSENEGHQILRWVDLSIITTIFSISHSLPEPLQPVEVTDETFTTTSFAATVATSTTTMSTETGTLATSTRAPSTDMETS